MRYLQLWFKKEEAWKAGDRSAADIFGVVKVWFS